MELIIEIENLLQQVAAINKSYEKIARITGENFNVFKILKVDTREVRLHSAFIAELLNPKGSHEQGNVFVIEFVKMLKEKVEINFDAENTTSAITEKWLGYKSEIDGGYIDILLTDKINKHIIIENKIYALDQKNQLVRYQSFDPEAAIVYLTLNGRQPSPDSTQNKKEIDDKLICISYEEDVLKWILSCKKFSVDHSMLRETLTQYINTIKHLTHQTMNENMNNEIINLILKEETNVSSAKEIISAVEKMKYISELKIVELKRQLETEFPNFNDYSPEQFEIIIIDWYDGQRNFGLSIKRRDNPKMEVTVFCYFSWDNFKLDIEIAPDEICQTVFNPNSINYRRDINIRTADSVISGYFNSVIKATLNAATHKLSNLK